MTKPVRSWNDDRLRLIMGTLLRVGVLTAASVVVLGGVLFFFQHPGEIIDYTTFKGEPTRLRRINVIIREAFNFKSRAVIQLGILLLIVTPLARVIFSWFGFILEKDWVYTLITFVVMSILCFSLFIL